MPEQTNKPGGSFDKSGEPRPAEDQQAVENQGGTSPDAYPEDDGGRPDYGSPKR